MQQFGARTLHVAFYFATGVLSGSALDIYIYKYVYIFIYLFIYLVFIWGRLVQGLLRVSLVLFEDWSGVDLGLICMILYDFPYGLFRFEKQKNREQQRSGEAKKQVSRKTKKQRSSEKQKNRTQRSGEADNYKSRKSK